MRSFYPRRGSDDHPGDHVVVFDIETIVDGPVEGDSFPKWPIHKPVVASFLTVIDRNSEFSFRIGSLVCRAGREAEFYELVDGELQKSVTSVAFNGRAFDLPVLGLGAIAERRFNLSGLSHHARAHRFGPDHCDLATMFGGHGATKTPSLAEICGRLGIPVKTSACGGDVAELWRAGDISAIKAYCEEDVAATYLVWLHWHAWRHSDETKISRPLAAFVKWIEREPGLQHLMPFATCEPARWARPRSIAADIDRALADADRRVRQAADERDFFDEDPIF